MINTTTPQQPGAWMPQPVGISGCPPGLEYLTQVDQLIVKQKVELLEVMTGFETANKYDVKNTMGQQVYKAKEHSGCLTRQCCGPNRGFKMEITDNQDRQVLLLDRPFNCNLICFPCCLHEMEVTSPISGQTLGSIKQDWHLTHPRFTIYDGNNVAIFKIEGPLCGCNWCSDVNFKVKDLNGNQVGLIQKQWTGLVKEAFTDADNFGVTFPMDLDPKMKAVLLGAVFMIDFMYFEHSEDNNNNNWG